MALNSGLIIINPWPYNELVDCRETLSKPVKVITYQQHYTKLLHQTCVSSHTLQCGSYKEQINDMTGLFATKCVFGIILWYNNVFGK